MIAPKELYEAIAECLNKRDPDAKTCAKLASYYIILDHLSDMPDMDSKYSYDPPKLNSNSEFGRIIKHVKTSKVLEVMDDLMETISVIEPRLYDKVMDKLAALK